MTEVKQAGGAFAASLLRKNSQIKGDRALAILRLAEKAFKRSVEDVYDKIFQLETDRDSLIDLSPTNADSLVMAGDFDATKFYETEKRLTLKIRECRVELEEMTLRYQHLFGKKLEPQATSELPTLQS